MQVPDASMVTCPADVTEHDDEAVENVTVNLLDADAVTEKFESP